MKRRHFMQFAGSALSAIGLSQLGLESRALHYGKALAQATPRKVALLVGVNDYPGDALDGPLNDIQLQRQLLIHRFGFNDRDVHLLAEEHATRQNILDAFNEYLYEPAQSSDVIVFHFSGHGDRVRESDLMGDFLDRLKRNCIDKERCLNTAIAPYRYDEDAANGVQDIMGHTLLLMRAALTQITENVTFVLDCCYAGGGKRGNAVMRSLNSAAIESRNSLRQISHLEWDYQQQLLAQLGWDEARFVDEVLSPKGQGFFVAAARSYELAADYSFNGFTAGAFTYLLTQYLWRETSPLSETIPRVANSSTRLAEHNQTPEYDPKPDAMPAVSQKPIYHLQPVSLPAEALVLPPSQPESAPDRVGLWLGGLDPLTLDAFDQGAVFSVIDRTTGNELGEVHPIEGTRQGLMAEGRLINAAPGVNTTNVTAQLLQEKHRGIPNKVTLKIGLDDTLTPSEQPIAMAELSASSDFEVFSATPGKSIHVLLGRYTSELDQRLIDNRVNERVRQTIGSVGLFSPAQEPILTGSFGPPGETIADAVGRLRSRFTSLYLGRLLALMVNQQASQINVSVLVEHLGSESGTTTRGGDPDAIIFPRQSERGIEKVIVGDRISVTIKNNEAKDLHFGILVIDAAGEVNVLFPPPVIDDPEIDVIARRRSRSENFRGAEPYGITELLVLASPQSLAGPLKKLRDHAPKVDLAIQRDAEFASVEAMDDIFGAMDTRRGAGNSNVSQGPRLLDVEEVAVLSLLFEIVPKDL